VDWRYSLYLFFLIVDKEHPAPNNLNDQSHPSRLLVKRHKSGIASGVQWNNKQAATARMAFGMEYRRKQEKVCVLLYSNVRVR